MKSTSLNSIVWDMSIDSRETQKAWLRGILERTGLTPTHLARHARLNNTTLTRFLNSPHHKNALSTSTVAAIQEAVKNLTKNPSFYETKLTPINSSAQLARLGLSESDAEPYVPSSHDVSEVDAAVQAAIAGRSGVDPWLLRSRTLEGAGYLPGDILIISLNESPRPGDAVCVQVYDWSRMKAETVMRIYEPPFLMSAEQGVSRKPLLLDEERVVVRGVVLASIRARRNGL